MAVCLHSPVPEPVQHFIFCPCCLRYISCINFSINSATAFLTTFPTDTLTAMLRHKSTCSITVKSGCSRSDISIDFLANLLQSALHLLKEILRFSGHLSFNLSEKQNVWLETMAVVYRYMPVNKSMRDLPSWACPTEDDDLDWKLLIKIDL